MRNCLHCLPLVLICASCAPIGTAHHHDNLGLDVAPEPDPGLELPWEMLPHWRGFLGHHHDAEESPLQVAPLNVQNPMFIPYGDREFIWDQVIDTIDDYFEIAREQRVQEAEGVLIEGRVETKPLAGATAFERWRLDSMPGFERQHATFQSIRRRAVLRAVPQAAGYQLELQVLKELEDVDRTDHATPGAATPRHDLSLVRVLDFDEPGATTLGWIAAGRDFALEQEMLSEIRSRLYEQGTNVPVNPGPAPY